MKGISSESPLSFVNLEMSGHYLKTLRAQCCCRLPGRVRPQNTAISRIGRIHLKCTLLCAVLTVRWPSWTHHFQGVLPLRLCFSFTASRQRSHLNLSHFLQVQPSISRVACDFRMCLRCLEDSCGPPEDTDLGHMADSFLHRCL